MDIAAGDAFARGIAAAQEGSGVENGAGGFAAVVRAGGERVALASDGVGSKAAVAAATGVPEAFFGLGVDLVAMVANDLTCVNAQPAFLLDYIATSDLSRDERALNCLLRGARSACGSAGMALVGGETAEMPGLFARAPASQALRTGATGWDVAAFALGTFEEGAAVLPDRSALRAGDAVLGLPSSGPHSNGFSLLREVAAERLCADDAALTRTRAPWWDGPGDVSVAAALLTPTVLYGGAVGALRRGGVRLKAMAHVTGGGVHGNLRRMVDGSGLGLRYEEWEWSGLWEWLRDAAAFEESELFGTFNCGVGFAVVVPPEEAAAAIALLQDVGVGARRVATVE